MILLTYFVYCEVSELLWSDLESYFFNAKLFIQKQSSVNDARMICAACSGIRTLLNTLSA